MCVKIFVRIIDSTWREGFTVPFPFDSPYSTMVKNLKNLAEAEILSFPPFKNFL